MTKRLFFKSILLITISWTTTTLCAKGEKSSAADSLPRLTARIDSFFERQRSAHMEKLWLHLDKPYYAAGDEMWFKAYLVDAVNHCSDTLSNFIYVDLIDRKGEIVFSKKIKRDRYGFTNNFIIPATFPTGDYTFRAYTGWMLNFDPAFFFQKNIPIGNPIADQIDAEISYTDLSAAKKQAVVRFRDENDRPYSDINIQFKIFDRNGKRLSSGQQRSSATGSVFAELPVISACEGGRIDLEIDNDRMYYKRTFFFPDSFSPFGIQFFPEGGDLIAGQPQRIAFKGESSDGSPISFSGTVFGSNGDTVARIVSEHDGMGVFTMSPQSGQDYRAEVTASDGRKLRTQLPTVKEDGYAIVVSQSPREIRYKIAAAPGSTCDSMTLVTHVRGICTAIVSVDSGNLIGGWPTDSLPEGILHLILLDARGKPRSERLVFVSHPHQREVWSIAPDKPKYGRREQVHVRIALTDANAIPLEADCSVSVTDNNSVKPDSLSDNIRSNLLLSSDLKGHVENPGYYFLNDAPDTRRRLDMVMMTNGWRRFDLNKINDTARFRPTQPVERDLFISGHVKWIVGMKAKNAPVIAVSSGKNGIISQSVKTDKKGDFRIGGLEFHDTAKFFVYSQTAKGKPMQGIEIDSYYSRPGFERMHSFTERTSEQKKEQEIYLENAKEKYYIEGGKKIYYLKGAVVRGIDKRRPRISVQGTLYDSARLSMFKPIPLPHFMARTFQMNTRTGMRSPTFYSQYNGFTTRDASYVKIDHNGQALVVEAVLKPEAELQRRARAVGAEICKMAGYAESVQFYCPIYSLPQMRESEKPDVRTTVYWNPTLKIGSDGTGDIYFYTDDNDSPRYDIAIEGVTRDGKPCKYWGRLQ